MISKSTISINFDERLASNCGASVVTDIPLKDSVSVDLGRSYPFLVVRLMSAVYQREHVTICQGPPIAHVGYHDTFVHHPFPYAADGSISRDCMRLMAEATLEAVQRTKFRMCLVWSKTHCTYVERDGTIRESHEPPSGGLGMGVPLVS